MNAETVTDREAMSPAALIPLLEGAAEAAKALRAKATEAVKAKVAPGGKAVIGRLQQASAILSGKAGTQIVLTADKFSFWDQPLSTVSKHGHNGRVL